MCVIRNVIVMATMKCLCVVKCQRELSSSSVFHIYAKHSISNVFFLCEARQNRDTLALLFVSLRPLAVLSPTQVSTGKLISHY